MKVTDLINLGAWLVNASIPKDKRDKREITDRFGHWLVEFGRLNGNVPTTQKEALAVLHRRLQERKAEFEKASSAEEE